MVGAGWDGGEPALGACLCLVLPSVTLQLPPGAGLGESSAPLQL